MAKINGGNAIITGTAHRRLSLIYPKGARGRIEVYIPGVSQSFEPIYSGNDPKFLPAGISVIDQMQASNASSQRIYVANAAKNGSGWKGSVEVFEYRRGQLVRIGNLGEKGLPFSPNGIAAAADGTVYVSGFSALPSGRDELTFTRPSGRAAFKNCIFRFTPARSGAIEGSWSWFAGGLNGINGLALAQRDQTLLVSSYHAKKVWTINLRPREASAATPAGTELLSSLRFHPDNLKHLGGERFTVCGQSNRWLALLELLLGLPVSPGSALEFRIVDGKAVLVADLKPLVRGDLTSPSTALSLDGRYYFAHVTARGVGHAAPTSVAQSGGKQPPIP